MTSKTNRNLTPCPRDRTGLARRSARHLFGQRARVRAPRNVNSSAKPKHNTHSHHARATRPGLTAARRDPCSQNARGRPASAARVDSMCTRHDWTRAPLGATLVRATCARSSSTQGELQRRLKAQHISPSCARDAAGLDRRTARPLFAKCAQPPCARPPCRGQSVVFKCLESGTRKQFVRFQRSGKESGKEEERERRHMDKRGGC